MSSSQIARKHEFQSQLLHGLSEIAIRDMLSACAEVSLPRNSIPVNQGQSAEHLFLLTKGRARFFFVTEDGRKIILRWIVPGHIFGASALLTAPSQYVVGTEMTQDSIVLTWSRAKISTLAARFPQLLNNVLRISQDYLLWYVAAHESLTTQNASERLAHLLLRTCDSMGAAVCGGIRLDVTNEELACAGNMTVFTVSRLLKHWQRLGIITKTRGRLLVRARQLLLEDPNSNMKRPSYR